MSGGYDDGYLSCPCFWGSEPGSLVFQLANGNDVEGMRVLDLGCGEGKNAFYLASRGAEVDAIDCSTHAISNASQLNKIGNVNLIIDDVIAFLSKNQSAYDIVIMYGLLHCLHPSEIDLAIKLAQEATEVGGVNLLCVFNDRPHRNLKKAHPGFNPTLLPHQYYIDRYRNWNLLIETDSNLTEVHPHNNVQHEHSMSRIVARRP